MKTSPWVKRSEAVFIATLVLAGPLHLGGCLMIMGEPDEQATPAKSQQMEAVWKVVAIGCLISWPCILATGIWHERLRSKWNKSHAANANVG